MTGLSVSPLRAAWILFAVTAASIANACRADDEPPYAPTDEYTTHTIEGWPVLVHAGFERDDADLCERTLAVLRNQLFQIRRRLPEEAIGKLRQVRIWVERAEPHHPCMAYHPDAGWLRDHGMNPDKAQCVELANAENFLAWTFDQPWMVLHELAHAYHNQFLDGGFENPEIAAAHRAAADAKLYDAVLRINGRTERAYALTNPMEYFAESTEAYFGTNDFYPYVRSELKEFDPKMHGVLSSAWGSAGPSGQGE